MNQPITDKDRERAKVCLTKCKGCKTAREKQKGFWYWFVKNIEPKLNCPWCKAYAKVYGRKAYEPLVKSST
jgi:hypothetical protein